MTIGSGIKYIEWIYIFKFIFHIVSKHTVRALKVQVPKWIDHFSSKYYELYWAYLCFIIVTSYPRFPKNHSAIIPRFNVLMLKILLFALRYQLTVHDHKAILLVFQVFIYLILTYISTNNYVNVLKLYWFLYHTLVQIF